jgi:hypothetical protein
MRSGGKKKLNSFSNQDSFSNQEHWTMNYNTLTYTSCKGSANKAEESVRSKKKPVWAALNTEE